MIDINARNVMDPALKQVAMLLTDQFQIGKRGIEMARRGEGERALAQYGYVV